MIRGANEAGGAGIAVARIRGRLRGRLAWAIGILFFIGVSVGMVAAEGLTISRDWVFVWSMLGLLLLSLGDVKRWFRGLVFDWLPFVGILFVYDIARGGADNLGIAPHTTTAIDVDRTLFGSPIPTVWLQDHLYHPFAVRWYDYGVFGVYMTHFFATVVVAALLWRYAYPQFRRFRTMILALTAVGFLTYVLFPATPPWLAAQQGHLPLHPPRDRRDVEPHRRPLPGGGPVRERQRLRERGGGHAVAPCRLPRVDPAVLLERSSLVAAHPARGLSARHGVHARLRRRALRDRRAGRLGLRGGGVRSGAGDRAGEGQIGAATRTSRRSRGQAEAPIASPAEAAG